MLHPKVLKCTQAYALIYSVYWYLVMCVGGGLMNMCLASSRGINTLEVKRSNHFFLYSRNVFADNQTYPPQFSWIKTIQHEFEVN